MIGHNRIGAGAYTSAIVQEAKKDWQYYEAKITASEECTGRLYREYKEGGAWKEKYKTWDDACVVLGKSRSQVNRVIAQDKALDSGASCANERDKAESDALKKLDKPKPEQKQPDPEPEPPEEPEKPAVHSADEVKVETNGHTKPKENGKPKHDMVVWRDLHDGYGRMMNLLDKAKAVCNSPTDHAWLISTTQACLNRVDAWKLKA